jgi:hypothetical protein
MQQWLGCKIPALIVATVVIRIGENKPECGKISSHRLLEHVTAWQAADGSTAVKVAVLEDFAAGAICCICVIACICASEARRNGEENDEQIGVHNYT